MEQFLFQKETFRKNAVLYKILANPIRLEILNLLRRKDHSVEELRKVIGIRKPTLSQHLAILRHMGIVFAKKNGLRVYYRITDPRIVEPCRILSKL